MKVEFVYFIVLWLNAFPVKTVISSKYSPRELLIRWRMDYKKHYRVFPGTYCEVHNEPVLLNTMKPRMHEAIALGPTRNLQGSMKFYSLDMGRMLKRHSFTAMPMSDRVIKWVNAIRLQELQGHKFCFLNLQQEPFTWTDEVPEDDPEFQGMLEGEEEEAIYPDILAELPGVTLEDVDDPLPVIVDEPELDFRELAVRALDNAGINPDKQLRGAHDLAPTVQAQGPVIVEANNSRIIYEVTFDLPNAGLGGVPAEPAPAPPEETFTDDRDNILVAPTAAADKDLDQCYPIQSRRSVVGHQRYDTYALRMTFLQLGTTQAHRSVIKAGHLARMGRAEWLLATMASNATCDMINNAIHKIDPELTTTHEDKV
jgi:hypothetical protein